MISVPASEYAGQPVRFTLDTRRVHDLISREKVEAKRGVIIRDDDGGMSFMTANCITQTQEVMNFRPKEFRSSPTTARHTCWMIPQRCCRWFDGKIVHGPRLLLYPDETMRAVPVGSGGQVHAAECSWATSRTASSTTRRRAKRSSSAMRARSYIRSRNSWKMEG